MFPFPMLTVVAMLFLAGDKPENPWKDKVPAAVQRAETRGTASALEEALDVTWRADDWQAGLRLAQKAIEAHPQDKTLYGSIVRALWRAGRIAEAERLAAGISSDTADRVALRALIDICLSRGQTEQAAKWADRLETLGPQTADDLYHLFAVRFIQQRMDGLADVVRKAERLVNVRNGYPESYLAESIEGLGTFLDAVGPEPMNQISRPGSAPMTALVMFNLPSCDVFINGRGPYRMVIDTGGSIMVALDETVATEIGLKSVAQATVRGVSGKQETGQALIEELQIGTITCRRIVTRTFDVHKAIMNAADGIIGTGVFASGRMTLDFANEQLIVGPSRDEPAPGQAVNLRLVADEKLMAVVTLQGEPAMAMLDSGADMVVLSPSLLKRVYPNREIQSFDPGMGLGIGADEMPRISLTGGVDLVLAGRTFKNYGGLGLDVLDTMLSPVMGVQTDILIGMPTFRQTKSCTVDFPTCRMWMDWLPME